ncbi:MAG: RDD family protein [Acidobacteriia bacterium]|nr:RDD family protein [Terriglobia bacterium]
MSPVSDPGTLYCAECGRPSTADELARFGDLLICPACKNNYAQKLREGVAPVATSRYAGFWIRFVAWLIDSIILMVVGSIVQFALLGSLVTIPRPQPGASPDAVFAAMLGMLGIVYLVNLVIACSYEAFFISSSLSATPGKLALGLKVLRPNGARLSLGRAVGRYFSKILSGLILLIGFIMAGLDSQKRGLHDMICDTRVIKTQD